MAESMKGLKRTHRCAELSAANVGEKVTIMGWVQKNRNKGGLVFVDVRDRSGIIQVVFEEGKSEAGVVYGIPLHFHFPDWTYCYFNHKSSSLEAISEQRKHRTT